MSLDVHHITWFGHSLHPLEEEAVSTNCVKSIKGGRKGTEHNRSSANCILDGASDKGRISEWSLLVQEKARDATAERGAIDRFSVASAAHPPHLGRHTLTNKQSCAFFFLYVCPESHQKLQPPIYSPLVLSSLQIADLRRREKEKKNNNNIYLGLITIPSLILLPLFLFPWTASMGQHSAIWQCAPPHPWITRILLFFCFLLQSSCPTDMLCLLSSLRWQQVP